MFNDSSDIVSLLRADHDELRSLMAAMKSAKTIAEKREIYSDFLPLLESHTFAEEETLMARSLTEEKLRADAMEGLEEHDVTEFEAEKIHKAATDDQWEARRKVLCELLEHHLDEEERDLFPAVEKTIGYEERLELGNRYTIAREKLKLAPILQLPIRSFALREESGRIGYMLAWLLGVPAWVLLMVFLVTGR